MTVSGIGVGLFQLTHLTLEKRSCNVNSPTLYTTTLELSYSSTYRRIPVGEIIEKKPYFVT